MDRWLNHLTLTTGHLRRSLRTEVADEAIAACAALLDAALADEDAWVPIPHAEPACSLSVMRVRRCLLVSVRGPEELLLATVGIAAESRCAPSLWRLLTEVGPAAATLPDLDRPAQPWCAARLEAGLAIYPEAAHWLGDFERCLAWAWIERIAARNTAQAAP